MTATLGYYNPPLFANEALIYLKKKLGFARTVYMGFDEERAARRQGDVINIRRPGTFTAASAPATAVDYTTESVQLSLSSHYEVKAKLTDKNFAYTGERVIMEHIAPMATALAQKIESDGFALYADIPNYYDVAGGASTTAVVADIIGARKVLFDAQVPMDQSALSLAIDSGAEAAFLGQSAFTQWTGSGDRGVAAQITGSLGARFGFGNIWATQNIPSHTPGTCNDTALQLVGAHTAGATTVNLDAVDAGVTGTLVPGDVLTIAHTAGTKRYAVTNTVTASGNAFTGVTITPALAADESDNKAVTASIDTHISCLAYHRDAFALAFARLPDFRENAELFGGAQLGANVFSVTDTDSGISVRARVYYVPNSSEMHIALDALYGWKTLNPYLAARLRG